MTIGATHNTVPWAPGFELDPISGGTMNLLLAIAEMIDEEPGINAAVLIDAFVLEWGIEWDACSLAVELVINLAMVQAYPDPAQPVGLA